MFNSKTSYEVAGLSLGNDAIFDGFINIGFNDNDEYRFDITHIEGVVIKKIGRGEEIYIDMDVRKCENSDSFTRVADSFIEYLKNTPYRTLQGVVDDARINQRQR